MKTRLFPSLLVWLRCFEAVARRNSFTRAAEELHMTQSAVSQQVKQLENRLEVSLLRRLQREVVLTTEGKPLYTAVHSGFQIIETAISQLQRNRSNMPLNVTCAPSFAMRWLMPRLGKFFLEHPEIGLRLHTDFPVFSLERPQDEEIEATICFEPMSADSRHSALILDEWIFPIASPLFLATHPELRQIDDLLSVWLLHDDSPWSDAPSYAEWKCWMEAVGIEDFDFQSGQRFNLSQLAVVAALSGQGIAMGRAAVIFDDVLAGRLVNVFGICAQSKASYFFTSASEPSNKILAVERWLCKETNEFRALRAKHLPVPSSD